MPRIFVAAILLLLVCISGKSIAQHKGYEPISDVGAFKERFAELSGSIHSISSTFSQEKVLSALAEKITSTGSFRFKRDNKVRIEYVKPFSYLMIMNGDRLYVKDQDKESRLNVKSNKLFQQVNQIMLDCIQGTILESKDFSSRIFEDEKTYLLEMTPSSKLLKDFFSNILLIVDKKDGAVQSIQMNEPSGDYTKMIFSDKKLNVPIGDEVFAL